MYTVYQWYSMINSFPAIPSKSFIFLWWLSYGHVPSQTAGEVKPMRCLRKQGDISGCETKTSHPWGAEYLFSFSHLMVMVGFLKTHTMKCQASVKAKSTYQNSAGLPDCSRPKPANNIFKKHSQLPWYRWISIMATETHHGQWCFSIHRCLPRDS